MSRYATKRELEQVVRETIETDWNDTGLPTDTRCYSMAGVMRDIGVIGDPRSGYTTDGSEAFTDVLRRNLRNG